MAEQRAVEVPLTPEEVKKILAICSPRGLLVGGQALAFWAARLAVELPSTLVPTVTADADFIGDSALAQELGKRLGWKTWVPSLDDATPNTGKVTQTIKGGGIKQVDFLSGVVGLTTKDVVRRAIELDVPKVGIVRVMHPIDVLDSRIQNLDLLPEKRNAAGIAQARLAVDVARVFIQRVIAEKDERAGLRLVERVVAIAEDIVSVRVFLLHGIDPLLAVPIDDFRTVPKLHTERWPQVQVDIGKMRDAVKKSLPSPRAR
jgi:hypothetical protein